jgi:hypothetical protein
MEVSRGMEELVDRLKPGLVGNEGRPEAFELGRASNSSSRVGKRGDATRELEAESELAAEREVEATRGLEAVPEVEAKRELDVTRMLDREPGVAATRELKVGPDVEAKRDLEVTCEPNPAPEVDAKRETEGLGGPSARVGQGGKSGS